MLFTFYLFAVFPLPTLTSVLNKVTHQALFRWDHYILYSWSSSLLSIVVEILLRELLVARCHKVSIWCPSSFLLLTIYSALRAFVHNSTPSVTESIDDCASLQISFYPLREWCSFNSFSLNAELFPTLEGYRLMPWLFRVHLSQKISKFILIAHFRLVNFYIYVVMILTFSSLLFLRYVDVHVRKVFCMHNFSFVALRC